jgi:hypothetical protein
MKPYFPDPMFNDPPKKPKPPKILDFLAISTLIFIAAWFFYE